MKIAQPKIFILAATTLMDAGKEAFLQHLGVPDWSTQSDSDGEELIEIAGKNCYQSFSLDLNENLTKVGGRNNHEYIREGIIATGHGSVLEHPTVTIAITNVSRVFTHELVRHRVGAAYSQQSGRYVRTNELEMYIPPDISEDHELLCMFIKAADKIQEMYLEMVAKAGLDTMTDFNKKKRMTSALRRIRPNGESNSIVLTYNHRTFRQTIAARTDAHAEEEIRVVFFKIFETLQEMFPAIYADGQVILHPMEGRAPIVKFLHSKI